MTKRNPGFHGRKKGFDIPKVPRKPVHACDLEEGDHIGRGCVQRTPVRPRDYLPREDETLGAGDEPRDLTEVIKVW